MRQFHSAYSRVEDAGEVHRGFHAVYTRPDLGNWWVHWFGGVLNRNKKNDRPSMADLVEQALNDVELTSDMQCFVTGHSLGGALATLSALHISQKTQFFDPILYTFANPRAGDGDFAAQCRNLTAYRVFNSEDLVPNLPLPTLKLFAKVPKETSVEQEYKLLGLLPSQGYEHVGDAVVFTDSRGTIPANHVIASYLDVLSKIHAAEQAGAQIVRQ